MKKVKSLDDLKRMALAKGASLEVGADRFNTTMERVHSKQAPAPEPKPEPVEEPTAPKPMPAPPAAEQATPPPAPPVQMTSVTEQIQVSLDMEPVAEAVNRGNERIAEVIKESLRQVSVPATNAAPGKWLFTIKRDTRGFIETVEAVPVK